jgi:hypothetical protein
MVHGKKFKNPWCARFVAMKVSSLVVRVARCSEFKRSFEMTRTTPRFEEDRNERRLRSNVSCRLQVFWRAMFCARPFFSCAPLDDLAKVLTQLKASDAIYSLEP